MCSFISKYFPILIRRVVVDENVLKFAYISLRQQICLPPANWCSQLTITIMVPIECLGQGAMRAVQAYKQQHFHWAEKRDKRHTV